MVVYSSQIQNTHCTCMHCMHIASMHLIDNQIFHTCTHNWDSLASTISFFDITGLSLSCSFLPIPTLLLWLRFSFTSQSAQTSCRIKPLTQSGKASAATPPGTKNNFFPPRLFPLFFFFPFFGKGRLSPSAERFSRRSVD